MKVLDDICFKLQETFLPYLVETPSHTIFETVSYRLVRRCRLEADEYGVKHSTFSRPDLPINAKSATDIIWVF